MNSEQPQTIATNTPTSTVEVEAAVCDWLDEKLQPVSIEGGKTAWQCGRQPVSNAAVLSTTGLNRIVDYAKRDMTITVQAGMSFGELQRILAAENQTLPIVVPFADEATIGGAIAANATGSLSVSHGSWRDYLLGITSVNGRAETIHAGGRVVKNVAGYDVCKIMIGSLGMLGVLTEVTLHVKPMPQVMGLVIRSFDVNRLADIQETLMQSVTRPAACDVMNQAAANQIGLDASDDSRSKWVLAVGFQGTSDEVNWQVQKLNDELRTHTTGEATVEDSEKTTQFWQRFADQMASCTTGNATRFAMKPSRLPAFLSRFSQLEFAPHSPVYCHAGTGTVLVHFENEAADPLKSMVATFNHAEAGQANVWENRFVAVMQHAHEKFAVNPLWPWFDVPESNKHLIARLLEAFDPHQLLDHRRYLPSDIFNHQTGGVE